MRERKWKYKFDKDCFFGLVKTKGGVRDGIMSGVIVWGIPLLKHKTASAHNYEKTPLQSLFNV